MHLTLKGYSPELIVEIPPYRIPSLKAWSNKLWFRIKDFLYEATPLVLLGIFLVNILDTLGVMDKLAVALSDIPGIPGTAARDCRTYRNGVVQEGHRNGTLIPIGLSAQQMLVAVVVLAMTFPALRLS